MSNSIMVTSEKSLEEMLNDCSIDAIIAIDTDKKIIAWNAMAEKIHGKNKHTVIGKSLVEVIPSMQEDEETLSAVTLALNGVKSFVPASKKIYHRKHAENHFIPLKDEGNIVGVMNLVHDVAHRIKAEEQLQHLNEELEKRYRQLQITADELASFTYISSNKIKEPIRQVYTGIEHLIKVEATRLTDSGKASFRRMQSSINRMDLLLDDILRLSKISILEKPDTPVDLKELFAEVSAGIKQKSEKSLNVIFEEFCTIKGHKEYLYILFYNLLDNAVKFNEQNVPVINIDCRKIVLTERMNMPEYYCVTITDNGIGFDDADAEKIFTIFEKLHDKKYKGSGMGLTIARKIMDAHNGFITAESTGSGAAFRCYFKLEKD